MTSTLSAAVASTVGDRAFVVALGGGADSAMLLHAAASIAPDRVRAVFVNQALPQSDRLESAAIAIASACRADLTILAGPVADGPNLEARARSARYRAIESDLDDELALTGHTADDQAETVLMRMLRGSGAGGLAGIPAERGPWRRPFLDVTRAELRSCALDLGLPFTDDPANNDDRFLRSKIRLHLMPLLETSYAPGVVWNLARSGQLLGADNEYIESAARQIPITESGGTVGIPVAPLLAAEQPVASRAVRAALRRCGDEYPGSMDDVYTVLQVAATGRAAHVSGHLHVRREPPFVVLGTRSADEPLPVVDLSSIDEFPWGGHRYRVSHVSYPTPVSTAGRYTVVATGRRVGPLEARSVMPGDRIDVGGGSTPVTEVLRDAGVAVVDRACWLLVTVGGMIAAVHGVRTASWAKPRTGEPVMIIERRVLT